MLEKLVGAARVGLAAGVLAFTGCGVHDIDRNDSIEIVAPQPVDTKLVTILEDLTSTPDAYRKAIEAWDDHTPIWPELQTKKQKLRFVQEVLRMDTLSHRAYVSDDDGGTAFTCRHFSRHLYFGYRLDGHPPKGSTSMYDVTRAPVKLRMPIHEVSIYFMHPMRENHRINGIHLGGDTRKSTHWLFLEPQTDSMPYRIAFPNDVLDGTLYIVHPHHDIRIDDAAKAPRITWESDEIVYQARFAGLFIHVPSMGSLDLTMNVYTKGFKDLYTFVVDHADEHYQHVDRIAEGMTKTAGFTQTEIQTMRDFGVVHGDLRSNRRLSSDAKAFIYNEFFPCREEYLMNAQINTLTQRKECREAFTHLARLGVLTRTEQAVYHKLIPTHH